MYDKPNSRLEWVLAEALDLEKIKYVCQHRVYERPGDLMPKYTLDFFIEAGGKWINVECDGPHHADKDVRAKDNVRNAWLFNKGFDMVLRFDSIDIEHNINYCVNEIKKVIMAYTGVTLTLKPENKYIENYRKPKRNRYLINSSTDAKTPFVNLYVVSHIMHSERGLSGAAVFQLEDVRRNRFSEEFILVQYNTEAKRCSTFALYEALKKLRKTSMLTVFTDSYWLSDVCNGNRLIQVSKKLDDYNLFVQINEELSKHNYRFVCLRKTNGKYKNRVFNCLTSRAKQMARKAKDELNCVDNVD